MNTEKIYQSEIADLKISSLPTCPNAPVSDGGKGLSAAEMKAAFDALPLFIVERLNSLIGDVGALFDRVEEIAAQCGVE